MAMGFLYREQEELADHNYPATFAQKGVRVREPEISR